MVYVLPLRHCAFAELAKGGDLTTDLKEYAEYTGRDFVNVASLKPYAIPWGTSEISQRCHTMC